MNNDDIFLALAMEHGILSNEELFDAGISEGDYFDLTDDALEKLELYYKEKRNKS